MIHLVDFACQALATLSVSLLPAFVLTFLIPTYCFLALASAFSPSLLVLFPFSPYAPRFFLFLPLALSLRSTCFFLPCVPALTFLCAPYLLLPCASHFFLFPPLALSFSSACFFLPCIPAPTFLYAPYLLLPCVSRFFPSLTLLLACISCSFPDSLFLLALSVP